MLTFVDIVPYYFNVRIPNLYIYLGTLPYIGVVLVLETIHVLHGGVTTFNKTTVFTKLCFSPHSPLFFAPLGLNDGAITMLILMLRYHMRIRVFPLLCTHTISLN